MKARKRIVVFLMALVLALPLVFGACKREDDLNYVGTLKIGFYKAGYGREFADEWAKAYNDAHPDAPIRFIIDDGVDGGVIGTRLETGSELCDIFMVMETGWQNWARSGWIEPLDDLMDMTNQDGNKFGDVLLDCYQTFGCLEDGTRYVLPQTGPSAPGFAYDETLMKKLFPDFTPPTTVDELRQLVADINAHSVNNDSDPDNDVAPFAWGGMVAGYWNQIVYTWWAQYDGEQKIRDFYEMETVDVYKPENRKGLEEALNLFREFVVGEGRPINSLPQAMSKNHIMMQSDFVLGNAALLVGIYGLQNETASIIAEDTVLKMFYVPFIEGAQTDPETEKPVKIAINEGQDFMFIPSASANKDLAKEFLLWISTNDMCRSYTRYSSFAAPYKYDKTNIEGVSSLTQCLIDETEDLVILGHMLSSNPIVNQLRLLPWGSNTNPYENMILNGARPREVLETAYTYAKGQWGPLQDEFFGGRD